MCIVYKCIRKYSMYANACIMYVVQIYTSIINMYLIWIYYICEYVARAYGLEQEWSKSSVA